MENSEDAKNRWNRANKVMRDYGQNSLGCMSYRLDEVFYIRAHRALTTVVEGKYTTGKGSGSR